MFWHPSNLKDSRWPEHNDRAELLEGAVQVARRDPPNLIEGDAVDTLAMVMAGVPDGSLLCILRLFTPIPTKSRDRFASLISEYGAQRDLFVISSKAHAIDESELVYMSFVNGTKAAKHVAYFQNHGAWIQWSDRASG